MPREIVCNDELPRNETGKVLKRELKGDKDDAGDKAEKADAKS